MKEQTCRSRHPLHLAKRETAPASDNGDRFLAIDSTNFQEPES